MITDDEAGLVATAIRHPGGFWPQAWYLADCERLRERGWLERVRKGNGFVYRLSERGYATLEMSGQASSVN